MFCQTHQLGHCCTNVLSNTSVRTMLYQCFVRLTNTSVRTMLYQCFVKVKYLLQLSHQHGCQYKVYVYSVFINTLMSVYIQISVSLSLYIVMIGYQTCVRISEASLYIYKYWKAVKLDSISWHALISCHWWFDVGYDTSGFFSQIVSGTCT